MEKEVKFREILSDRLLEFASRVIKLESKLCSTYIGKHIFGQLFRSASSSGANYQESVDSESKADFVHKTQIVLKELRESNYWIKLIIKTGLVDKDNSDINFLFNESYDSLKYSAVL